MLYNSLRFYYSNSFNANFNHALRRFVTAQEQRQLFDKDYADIILKIPTDITTYLGPKNLELKKVIDYNFLVTGKLFRPKVVVLLSAVVNNFYNNRHDSNKIPLTESQYKISLISEMIHTVSLIHDDLIDNSEMRRGKLSAVFNFDCTKAILSGDYILTRASQLLASIGNTEVVIIISDLIQDLIKGEIMQLTSYEDIDEKFAHYYLKTYRKTASLIANCCKSAALLSDNKYQSTQQIAELAYEFGRNVGMAFQLIDDVLDVVASSDQLGKPGGGQDMKLGLATGPVLFAAEKFPEVNEVIIRKCSMEGDLERMMNYIVRADGVEKTKCEAKMFYDTSLRILRKFPDSPFRTLLQGLVDEVFYRIN